MWVYLCRVDIWYRLSEILYKRDSKILNEIYRPYIERLIHSLGVHCQMDSDHASIFVWRCMEDHFRSCIYMSVTTYHLIPFGSVYCQSEVWDVLFKADFLFLKLPKMCLFLCFQAIVGCFYSSFTLFFNILVMFVFLIRGLSSHMILLKSTSWFYIFKHNSGVFFQFWL